MNEVSRRVLVLVQDDMTRRSDSAFNQTIAGVQHFLTATIVASSLFVGASDIAHDLSQETLGKSARILVGAGLVKPAVLCVISVLAKTVLHLAYGPRPIDKVLAEVGEGLKQLPVDQRCAFLCEIFGYGLHQREDFSKLLIEASINSTCQDENGNNAYQCMVLYNQSTAIASLSKICTKGLDQATPQSPLPPVVLAAQLGRLDCLRALIQAGANLQTQDQGGTSVLDRALQEARAKKYQHVVVFLEQQAQDSKAVVAC